MTDKDKKFIKELQEELEKIPRSELGVGEWNTIKKLIDIIERQERVIKAPSILS